MGIEFQQAYESPLVPDPRDPNKLIRYSVSNIIVLGRYEEAGDVDSWKRWRIRNSSDELPSHIMFDRVYIHTNDEGRIINGFLLDGKHVGIVDSYISGLHAGSEAHAFIVYDGAGPYKIVNNYLEATGVSGRDGVVIYDGVDTERFRPREHRRAGKRGPGSEVRAQLGVGDDEQLSVGVCRLIPQKRPELLLSAFAIVHKSRPGTRLLILGSGELRDSLVELSRELGIAHSVIFAGYREDVAECLAASDVFVSSSAKEGFSNVLLEALATGLPAVVTDVGGNREAVRDGQEGFLCEPSAERLAERVVRIVTDAELRKEMSRNARRRAMEFGLERMADQTAALYDRLLSRKMKQVSDE